MNCLGNPPQQHQKRASYAGHPVFFVLSFLHEIISLEDASTMARRKKNMTYEEELTYLDSEISKTEETLKALKTRKKELAKVKEQADLQTLYAAIKESGKSVADVISSLK